MSTLVCTIKLGDGGAIIGRAEAASDDLKVPIKFEGAVSLLRNRVDHSDLAFLEWYFGQEADHLGALLEVKRTGLYDSQAPQP